jgi:radical SAM protein with 4Fe4S-binding SPASM domain
MFKEPKMNTSVKSSVETNRIELHNAIPLASPLVVYVELSGHCNFQCKFCPHYTSPEDLVKDNMTLDLFKKMLSDMQNLKPIKVLRYIGTGEPLLNKNFLEMAKLAKESGVAERYELTTNGVLLSQKKYRNEITKNLDRIIISIEGLSDKSYFDITGQKVNFAELVENIKQLFLNKRNCNIYIKIHNDAIKNEDDLKLFHKIFDGICDQLFVENLVNLWPETISNLGLDAGFRFGGQSKPQKVCTQIFKSMMINANGEVVPCCVDFKRINVIGNINNQSLSSIWNGKIENDIRVKHLSGKGGEMRPCNSCEYYYSDLDNIDEYADEILSRLIDRHEDIIGASRPSVIEIVQAN